VTIVRDKQATVHGERHRLCEYLGMSSFPACIIPGGKGRVAPTDEVPMLSSQTFRVTLGIAFLAIYAAGEGKIYMRSSSAGASLLTLCPSWERIIDGSLMPLSPRMASLFLSSN